MNKVELRFVPLWVQRALEASGLGLGAALDNVKMTSILSTRDLEKYEMAQAVLCTSFFFKMVCGSFENFSGDNAPECVAELDNERLADLVYGHIPMGEVRNSTPAYTTSIHGDTDAIIVSVLTGPDAEQFCKHMFMKSLVEKMIGLRNLEHVAPLPVFKEWIQKID